MPYHTKDTRWFLLLKRGGEVSLFREIFSSVDDAHKRAVELSDLDKDSTVVLCTSLLEMGYEGEIWRASAHWM